MNMEPFSPPDVQQCETDDRVAKDRAAQGVLRVGSLAARPQGGMPMDQRKPVPPAGAPDTMANDAARPPPVEDPAPPALTPDADRLISRQLRAIYDEVVNEPVPEAITRLLEALERKRTETS